MLSQLYQVGAEIEEEEGTAETLVAEDVVLVFKPKFTPDIAMHKRYPGRSHLSPYASLPGARSGKMSFDIELVGASAAGVAPHFSDIIQGCGALEAVEAASVTYTPASSDTLSLTLGHWLDGKRRQIWGARGNAKLVLEAGKPGIFSFDFQGADFDVADEPLLADTVLNTVVPPVLLSAALEISGYAALVSKVEIDFGNKLVLRKDANSASGNRSCIIAERTAVMRIDPEDVLVATEDFLGDWRSGAEAAFTAVLGSTEGNTITVTAPAVQYQGVTEGERDGVAVLEIEAQLNASAGDDEWSIAIT